MTVKDALKLYNNKPEIVPITRELITLAQNSHKSYIEFFKESQQKKRPRTNN